MMKDTMYIGQTTKSILAEVFTDNTYAEMVYEEIIDEVVEDVETSADVNFNYSDISLAVQRSILRKMNIFV
ncbi:MAG: hypothetical protein J6Q39_03010 [Bacteroidales bacterium]|nr:hypothetical protein [Bacteroidales bacterium]